MDAQDLIDLAIAHLGTVHTVAGHGLHMHYDRPTVAWWMVTSADLVALGEMLSRDVHDAYSHWCAQTGATAVDAERTVLDYDADETTDLDDWQADALRDGDMVAYLALRFLREDVEEIIDQNAELAAGVA